jgi:hypothetical protein
MSVFQNLPQRKLLIYDPYSLFYAVHKIPLYAYRSPLSTLQYYNRNFIVKIFHLVDNLNK